MIVFDFDTWLNRYQSTPEGSSFSINAKVKAALRCRNPECTKEASALWSYAIDKTPIARNWPTSQLSKGVASIYLSGVMFHTVWINSPLIRKANNSMWFKIKNWSRVRNFEYHPHRYIDFSRQIHRINQKKVLGWNKHFNPPKTRNSEISRELVSPCCLNLSDRNEKIGSTKFWLGEDGWDWS